MMNKKYIFSDGSAINNGRRNCVAAYAVYCGENDPNNIAMRVTKSASNQRAELSGVHHALKIVQSEIAKGSNCMYVIITDSMYAIQCLTLWGKKWEKNKWKKVNGSEIKHLDIIAPSLNFLSDRCELQHVNSHRPPPNDVTSHEFLIWYGNMQADKMARGALF